jgi:hypothetical protein
MSQIVSFYEGKARDMYGRTIDTLWSYNDDLLEDVHNFIQLLFPLETPSQFVAAPVLDAPTIRAFHDRPDLQDRLLRSLDLMLRFYGFRREAGPRDGEQVVLAPDFAAKSANWLTPYNHNFLRLTRILISLKTLGLGPWSRALFERLRSVYEGNRDVIGLETFRYWQEAVR